MAVLKVWDGEKWVSAVDTIDVSKLILKDGSNQPFTGNISAPNLSGNNTGDQTSSDFNLSDLKDVDSTNKATGKILKVRADGKHEYVNESSGGGVIKYEVLNKVDNYSVSTSDIGKIITMDSSSEKTFTLPSVTSLDIGTYFTFVKLGEGKLNITASDNDVILDSGVGGTIYNNDITDIYASLTLILISETKWITKEATHGNWVID